MDIFFGPKVLRIRLLRPSPTRRFAPRLETLSAIRVRHAKAVDLLERRKAARLEGLTDTATIDAEIGRLGYEFEDEPTRDDCAYSYWRRK